MTFSATVLIKRQVSRAIDDSHAALRARARGR